MEQKAYVLELLRWRLHHALDPGAVIPDQKLIELAIKLATPRGSQRYSTVNAYRRKEADKQPAANAGIEDDANANSKARDEKGEYHVEYYEWLDRVLIGYAAFLNLYAQIRETPLGPRTKLQDILHNIASISLKRIYRGYVAPEAVEDLASRLYIKLLEDYFFDTLLEQWLRVTARNLIHNDLRRPPPGSLDELPSLAALKTNPAEWALVHQAMRRAIRQVENQTYRVILLLLYLYGPLDNRALGAFFGVTPNQAATRKSRARSKLKEYYSQNL